MSKMKKVLLMCTAYVLVAALAIGGTIAYLTSEDSDVNVMTLGNVTIEQHEQQLADDGVTLEPFEQAKDLYPGKPNTAISKIVTVENTGKSDAYFRTLIAFEDIDSETFGSGFTIFQNPDGSWNSDYTWGFANVVEIEVDGVKYDVWEALYNGVLPAGETSSASLTNYWLKETCTNEDMEALGGTYEILVLSQAVQADGFVNAETALNTAFGELTAEKAAEWFGGVEIPNVLADALGINKSTNTSGTFVLADDIETTGDASASGATRYGYGYEYIIRSGVDYTLDLNGKTISHKAVNENSNHDAFTYLFVANNAGTELTIDGDGSVYCNNSEGYTCAVQGKSDTLITINGGDFEVDNGIAVWAGAGAHIVINDGSFVNGEATTDHELIYSSGGVIDIYGGFFHNTDGNYTLNVEDRNRATGFINVYGGTYVNFDPSTGGQDPNNIKVADGYKVVSETQANGDVWYTVVAE